MVKKGLLERLKSGEGVVVAEGYLFEFENRGYLKAGGFVPEVVLEHPDLVKNLHREYVHAGSNVVLAFTYYGHRQKMRLIGREAELETMNRRALQLAREVANETGTLMAGNICNSTIFNPDDEEVLKQIYDMMAEQVAWAVEEGADFIVAETFQNLEEALLAVKAIKDKGKGLPSVVTLAHHKGGITGAASVAEACRHLEEAGADVVGVNCTRGPKGMLKDLQEIRKVCKGPIAALPVPYRTDDNNPTFQSLPDVDNPQRSAFPIDLDPWLCSRSQIHDFARQAWDLGVRYIGLCCGNKSHLLREMSMAVGRTPPAAKYAPDMSLHYSRIKDDRHSFTRTFFEENYKTS